MIAVLLMLAALLPSALHAAERDAAAPPASCIEAEVNGYRSLSYDCLNQDMAQRLARQRPPAQRAGHAHAGHLGQPHGQHLRRLGLSPAPLKARAQRAAGAARPRPRNRASTLRVTPWV